MPTEPAPTPDDSADPVFDQEQSHLAHTYAKLQQIGRALVRKMERAQREAAADKKAMAEELAPNFATYADAMETYADFAAMNRVIDGYNLAQDADAAELAKVELLLKQPYFAKVALQFKPGQEPKELYIGTAGISDAASWWTGARPWPRPTTTRTTAAPRTWPTAAPSKPTSSCAASSTSRKTA